MSAAKLYKYLDAEGGLKMLEKGNLQFTNATKLNDPFDCHPALFDYSEPQVYITEDGIEWPPSDFLSEKGANDMTNLRNSTWICSLSKVYDSLLMWSYYNNHKGICIGINMEVLRPNLPKMVFSSVFGVLELEVKYDDIIKKPNFFQDHNGYWGYQVSTKAKDWSHEKEVRLVLLNPSPGFIPASVPRMPEKDEILDRKEFRFYPYIDKKCFDAVYLGVSIDEDKKEKLIKAALTCNPDIKIYQMKVDPEAFKLNKELL